MDTFATHIYHKSMKMAARAQAIGNAAAQKAKNDAGPLPATALPPISKSSAGATAGLSVMATPSAQPAAGFHVIYSGQVEAIHYPDVNNLYCRYAITYGTDWRVLHGADAGLSQMAYKSNQEDDIVLNFPIDVSFKSTNPFGWPRIVLSIYGLDALGRDVIRGYGSVHLPTFAGSTTREVPLFKPLSSSLMQQFTAWLTGSPPEYFDSKFITQNDGREVTRVCSAGKVRLVLNVVTSGMKKHGYA